MLVLSDTVINIFQRYKQLSGWDLKFVDDIINHFSII